MTAPSQTRVRTVLVVEDDPTLCAALVGLLEDEGFEVISAGTLRRARKILLESFIPVSVLVLDLALPDGAGEELLAELSRHSDAPPTVLISAVSERAARAAVTFGLPHAAKPFDLTLVATSVAVAFENDVRPRGPTAGPPGRTPSTRRFRAV